MTDLVVQGLFIDTTYISSDDCAWETGTGKSQTSLMKVDRVKAGAATVLKHTLELSFH